MEAPRVEPSTGPPPLAEQPLEVLRSPGLPSGAGDRVLAFTNTLAARRINSSVWQIDIYKP